MKKSLFIFVLFLGLNSAQAASGEGFSLGLPFSYESSDDGTTSSSSLLMDVSIGYTMSSGLYLGAIYVNDDLGSPIKRNAMGLSVGYGINWWIKAHYFISSEIEFSPGSSWTKGTGFGASFGYNFELNSWFSLGPQLTYRSLKFTEDSLGNTIDKENTEMQPYISMVFNF